MPVVGVTAPLSGWPVWGRPLGYLLLILFGPLLLLPTPLAGLAMTWMVLVFLAFWAFCVSLLIGAMLGTSTRALGWIEGRLRQWVARFAPDPEALWIHWAKRAHLPQMAHWYLDRAVLLGGAEAIFQEGLAFHEGGFGAGGHPAAVERFRKAAALGHAEAAFRLAEALRTGAALVVTERAEAETWYRRSATKGFGPAAAWLARAYATGDGVALDEAQAWHWSEVAARLQPHQPLSRSVLRHDAAPPDPLVRLRGEATLGLERGLDQFLAHRAGRWILALGACLLGALGLGMVMTIFLTGSAGLFHLPLLMLAPPALLLGWQAWRHWRERPSTRRDPLREAAEAGDPEACFQVGLRHRLGGPHLPKDDLGAAVWFRKAAEAGHLEAMAALAEAYLGGHGVVRDPREAARWAEAAQRESTS